MADPQQHQQQQQQQQQHVQNPRLGTPPKRGDFGGSHLRRGEAHAELFNVVMRRFF